ncbi:MAG: hypothetical protein E7359_00470 [Clostridiales bacterium]|nr:hypothetical protein [Clostridiales bacterium]
MIKYTKEQQEAIDYFDTDLLISASAGSGKTQVLLEKVLKLLENKVDINEILMVTFTNLAASEMKSKLENMILDKIEENSCDFLFDALNKLNAADICTLHSFCQKLVREYYYLLNIEPNFEIRDEAYIQYLKNRAINDTIRDYLLKNDKDFINVSNLFVYKRDYTTLKEEIIKFYDFLTSKLNKYEFCDEIISANYNVNLNKNLLISKFKDYTFEKINNFRNEIFRIKLDAEKINSEKIIKLCDEFIIDLFNDIKNNEDFISFYKQKIDFPQIRLKNNATYEEVELKEKLQLVSKKIKKFLSLVKEVFECESLEDIKLDLINGKQILNKFIEIVKSFEENFKKLKRNNNCLDFNDLEELTLKILNNERILEEISCKYKYIFVDEYQDTNLVQEEILKLLSKHSKRIMVGDIKQSIYAFRQCNPKIFSDKLERYSKLENGKVILLNKNFRSHKNILEFSNNIFSNLMRKENCDYSYKDNGMFVFGRESENENIINNVEVLCVNKNESEDYKNSENLLILNTINNLLTQKIIENGNERNFTFKDIAIISRKRNAEIINLCKLFDEVKIPYSVKYYDKIYTSFEIKLIISYLNLLNNLDNDICLYSVLRNIYGFKTNELITIKSNSLKSAIEEYSKTDVIYSKIKAFFDDFYYFKQKIGEISVKQLIEEIINKLKLEIILNKEFGKISSEKLNVFIKNIPSNIYSLSEFLLYCDDLEDKKFEIKKVVSDNCITIDTFHSTKGLEYNAIIVINAGDKIFAKNSSNLIYNAKFGIGIFKFNEEEKIKAPNIVYSIINILNKQEEFNEEVRLSYVAFTRAKNYLTIIGSEKKENLIQEDNYLNFLDFTSYLNLICSKKFNNDNFKFTYLNGNEEIFKTEIINQKDDNNIVCLDFENYNKIVNKKYDYINSTTVQLKNSVTSISDEDKFIYNISNFKITDNDSEDFIEIGNSYHLVLEKLPFNLNTIKEVKNKIINLVENKIIPENIYNYIEDEKVLKALKTVSKLIEEKDKVFKEQVFMVYMPHNTIKNSDLNDKILVQGIIDIYIEKENEIILIDYKTSRLNDLNLINKYSIQLNLYEKALKEKYKNKTIKKYIYSIFLDKLINIV